MTHVLIAVDDSDASVGTARTAYALFGPDAEYTIVNVADRTPVVWGGDTLAWGVGYPMMIPPAETVVSSTAPAGDISVAEADSVPIETAIGVARGVADEADIPNPQVVGEVGDPATAIINAAHHHQADVIVVGSHERSWFSKLFSPSTSGAVLREADIPVLVTH